VRTLGGGKEGLWNGSFSSAKLDEDFWREGVLLNGDSEEGGRKKLLCGQSGRTAVKIREGKGGGGVAARTYLKEGLLH